MRLSLTIIPFLLFFAAAEVQASRFLTFAAGPKYYSLVRNGVRASGLGSSIGFLWTSPPKVKSEGEKDGAGLIETGLFYTHKPYGYEKSSNEGYSWTLLGGPHFRPTPFFALNLQLYATWNRGYRPAGSFPVEVGVSVGPTVDLFTQSWIGLNVAFKYYNSFLSYWVAGIERTQSFELLFGVRFGPTK